MRYTIFDIESDGLLETVTKIHCLSYATYDEGILIETGNITTYAEIIEFLALDELLIGHNIIKYDIPVIEKVIGIVVNNKLVDTLGLSWYLYPERVKHGLEIWGEELGIPKPNITDWENLSLREYIHRCESDVKINSLLWNKQFAYLGLLYEYNIEQIFNIINYLGFKLDCAREQEEVMCKIDVPLVEKSLLDLNLLREEKVSILSATMPRDIKYKEVIKPEKIIKQDGSISVAGQKWYNLLLELNLPLDTDEPIMVIKSDEIGNPGSSIQLKNWLFSLGWTPTTFEHRKNSAGEVKAIPQIYDGDGVCESIKVLYEIEPTLENLDMLSLINHRIGVFKAYKSTMNEEGFTSAQIHGFTNTLRFRHKKPIANLPSVYKFYGKEIRGAVIAPNDDYTLCGADMSSLEDTTKQHYMYFFDPQYVIDMRVPGFDPHLDIALLAKLLTEEQVKAHKEGTEDHSNTRKQGKVVNFSGIYGAGPPKIAAAANITVPEARTLHKIYWERNKSVKLIEKSCKIKTIDGQMWLFNPVSKFWYSLRYMKDRFSTLNQGTGVYCFDLWVRELRSRAIKIILQYHDEVVTALLKGKEEQVEKKFQEAIEAVNQKVNLNVPLGIDVQFGANYAEIH